MSDVEVDLRPSEPAATRALSKFDHSPAAPANILHPLPTTTAPTLSTLSRPLPISPSPLLLPYRDDSDNRVSKALLD